MKVIPVIKPAQIKAVDKQLQLLKQKMKGPDIGQSGALKMAASLAAEIADPAKLDYWTANGLKNLAGTLSNTLGGDPIEDVSPRGFLAKKLFKMGRNMIPEFAGKNADKLEKARDLILASYLVAYGNIPKFGETYQKLLKRHSIDYTGI